MDASGITDDIDSFIKLHCLSGIRTIAAVQSYLRRSFMKRGRRLFLLRSRFFLVELFLFLSPIPLPSSLPPSLSLSFFLSLFFSLSRSIRNITKINYRDSSRALDRRRVVIRRRAFFIRVATLIKWPIPGLQPLQTVNFRNKTRPGNCRDGKKVSLSRGRTTCGKISSRADQFVIYGSLTAYCNCR